MSIHMKTTLALATSLILMFVGSMALAWNHGPMSKVDRVAEQSANFVVDFNAKDNVALGRYYVRNKSVLKLPNAPAVSGRDAIVEAWGGGFAAGLDALVLSVDSLEEIGRNQVLENGTYELTILTPNGPIVQEGTYAVTWRVPNNPNRRPRIIFDSIDAN